MSILKKISDWLIYSSKNPDKISLTIKGLIPFVALLGFGPEIIADTSNGIIEIVIQAGAIVTGIITLWGAIRKIYLSFKPK